MLKTKEEMRQDIFAMIRDDASEARLRAKVEAAKMRASLVDRGVIQELYDGYTALLAARRNGQSTPPSGRAENG